MGLSTAHEQPVREARLPGVFLLLMGIAIGVATWLEDAGADTRDMMGLAGFMASLTGLFLTRIGFWGLPTSPNRLNATRRAFGEVLLYSGIALGLNGRRWFPSDNPYWLAIGLLMVGAGMVVLGRGASWAAPLA